MLPVILLDEKAIKAHVFLASNPSFQGDSLRNVTCNIVGTRRPLKQVYFLPRIPHFKVILDESTSPSNAPRAVHGDSYESFPGESDR